MKTIPLTKGKEACVDDESYVVFPLLTQMKWKISGSGYAICRKYNKLLKKYYIVRMHRMLINAPDNMDVDHINGDKLDNRTENLRLCSRTQNNGNAKMHLDNKSGYKGVYQPIGYKKWLARIQKEGQAFRLGSFNTKEAAAKAYNKAAKELFGEFARLNKI